MHQLFNFHIIQNNLHSTSQIHDNDGFSFSLLCFLWYKHPLSIVNETNSTTCT